MPIEKMPKSGGRTQPVAKKTTAKKPAAKKVGRPEKYSLDIRDIICEEISNGKSLRTICESKSMPAARVVFSWLASDEGFAQQYARACEERGEWLAERAIEVAEDSSKDTYRVIEDGVVIALKPNNAAVQRSKLKVDTYKWFASKLAPKKYGDKLEVGGEIGGSLSINIVNYNNEEDAGGDDGANDSA